MRCSRCECAYLSIIIGIVAGVLLGVLFALGFVATGIIFWALLAIGVAGVFLAPLYAANTACPGTEQCFCNYLKIFLTASAGTIVASSAGLIVAPLGSIVATAIILGLATFFAVTQLVSTICVAKCLCNN
ncbi:MAG: hypothetical protein IJE62_06940 [Clostridia bacterium]|nr:hypothetical protein [Clostridia bacterium]